MTEKGKELRRNVIGSGAGATIGFAIGGPIGAVVGGVTGPLATFAIEMAQRRHDRATKILELASQKAQIDSDVFTQKIIDNQELGEFAAIVLNSSTQNTFVEKVEALSSLLSTALQKNADEIGTFIVMCSVLDDLAQPHVNVLLFLHQVPEGVYTTPETIKNKFPEYHSTIRSVVRTLELHGLIVDDGILDQDTKAPDVRWRTSQLGNELAAVLLIAKESTSNQE